ncbi:MAG: VPLPA-CTERM-specific exosortase XrtD [Sedimenticola sp.]
MLLLGVIFYDGLELMVKWWEREEYSHGYMLPFVVIYLIWQKRPQLIRTPFRVNWYGVVIVVMGLFIYLVGELSTLYTIIQYGFLITLAGLALSLMGWSGFNVILAPFLVLFFMVPLPNFLYNNLSAALQLISSQIGVDIIRLFGISVFLEGNVIDLGDFKLQVVEACSGLRYLFPLTALGFIAAYLYKAAFWKKSVIFLSTIPITVLMNSFRIGVIGVLVEHWGQSMAEGFLHDFEGWFVFMACAALLVFEMWLFSLVGKDRLPLREAFALELPAPVPMDAQVKQRSLPTPFYAAFTLLLMVAVASQMLPEREELVPQRLTFDAFPTKIGDWQGSMGQLEPIYIDALKLDDHLLADYRKSEGAPVNFYVAYYDSQRKGASAHSPKSCLPGGGWKMTGFEQRMIEGVRVAGQPLQVNRVVIQLGDVKQLVYYWFQQRGRVITSEYMVKWYLFWDSLTRNRTDGTLVRLTTMVAPGQDVAEVDLKLVGFAQDISDELKPYIPN